MWDHWIQLWKIYSEYWAQSECKWPQRLSRLPHSRERDKHNTKRLKKSPGRNTTTSFAKSNSTESRLRPDQQSLSPTTSEKTTKMRYEQAKKQIFSIWSSSPAQADEAPAEIVNSPEYPVIDCQQIIRARFCAVVDLVMLANLKLYDGLACWINCISSSLSWPTPMALTI